MSVSLAVVGLGAFGRKHLDALARIDDVRVGTVVDTNADVAARVAAEYGADSFETDYDEVLRRGDIDGVILATPSPDHHRQTIAALRAGKHVMTEIPLGLCFRDVEDIERMQRETGLIAMAGHTRRFNPSHQFVHEKIRVGEFSLLQLDVQTYFLRRSNLNALGEPRSWTDHLLWHHAAHTIDLFQHQTGGAIVQAHAIQGPRHPELGIAMDMSVQLRSEGGSLCTLSLSFNNDGPLGTTFRYIGDSATYIARYDELTTGNDEAVDVSGSFPSQDGIELQDREFAAAIHEGRTPASSVADVLPCYKVLGDLQAQLDF